MAMSAPRADATLTRPDPGSSSFRPVLVAIDRCKGCALCVDACATGALALDPTGVNAMGYRPVVLAHPDQCTSCAKCARMCPDAALSVFARPREG